jgi:hypothetical protein
MRSRLAALAIFVSTCAAPAAPFNAQHGHWTVVSLASSCMAFNRPSEEFNATPFNALGVHQRRGGAPTLQIFVWPDVFKPGQPVDLALARNNRGVTEVKGAAVSPYHAETPLTAALRGELSGGRMLEVEITGVPARLFFEISQLETVLGSLQACAQQLPPR